MGKYRAEAIDDAKQAAKEHLHEIVENVMSAEGRILEIGMSDYSEDYIQTFTDRSYKLKEAAELLVDLDGYEETDSSFWEGEDDPREALKTMAAMTYGIAVSSFFTELMVSVNEIVEAALGNKIYFDFDEWLEQKGKVIQKGAFEWMPGVTAEEREEQEEELKKEHMDETLNRLEKIVKEAIETW